MYCKPPLFNILFFVSTDNLRFESDVEDTQNGRQTLMSPCVGGSSHDCPVPGKRLMHYIVLLPSSYIFSSISLPLTQAVCMRQKKNLLSSLEIRGRKMVQSGLPLGVDMLCVILSGFYFSKKVFSRYSWCIWSLSPFTVNKISIVTSLSFSMVSIFITTLT